jgi:hypothetical protein
VPIHGVDHVLQEGERPVAESGRKSESWLKEASIDARLDVWWSKLLPAQRTTVIRDFDGHLPEWMSQSLLRWGVPLSINPGLAEGSTAGHFVVPPECVAFIERKRRQPDKRRRFWRRRSR